MSQSIDTRKEAILSIVNQLEVPEHQDGDIELLKTLINGESIEDYVKKIYSTLEDPPQEPEFVNIRPVDKQ